MRIIIGSGDWVQALGLLWFRKRCKCALTIYKLDSGRITFAIPSCTLTGYRNIRTDWETTSHLSSLFLLCMRGRRKTTELSINSQSFTPSSSTWTWKYDSQGALVWTCTSVYMHAIKRQVSDMHTCLCTDKYSRLGPKRCLERQIVICNKYCWSLNEARRQTEFKKIPTFTVNCIMHVVR